MQDDTTKKTCEHCGGRLLKYTFRLQPLYITALVKFRRAISYHGRNEIHLKHDMDEYAFELDRYERSNWTMLRFFGLVAKVRENGVHKRGYWLLTKRGSKFLNGEIAIPKSVQVFRNVVVAREDRLAFLKDVLGYFPSSVSIEHLIMNAPTGEEIEQAVSYKVKRRARSKVKIKNMCLSCGGKMKRGQDVMGPFKKPTGEEYYEVNRYMICRDCNKKDNEV